jgi:hypothetical protein
LISIILIDQDVLPGALHHFWKLGECIKNALFNFDVSICGLGYGVSISARDIDLNEMANGISFD